MPLSSQRKQSIKAKPDETELAQIDYLYDFNSIFATPEQEALFARPYGSTPVRRATGGLLGSEDGAEVVAEILGMPIEEVTKEHIDLVVELIAQQTVLSAPEMQYDESTNNAVDVSNKGVVEPTNQNGRDTYTEELLKLLGE